MREYVTKEVLSKINIIVALIVLAIGSVILGIGLFNKVSIGRMDERIREISNAETVSYSSKYDYLTKNDESNIASQGENQTGTNSNNINQGQTNSNQNIINQNGGNSSQNEYLDGIGSEFTREKAFEYLQEHFKDSDNVLYSNIIDEVYVNGEKYYTAKLYNKELIEAGGSGTGDTVMIGKDKKIYTYND